MAMVADGLGSSDDSSSSDDSDVERQVVQGSAGDDGNVDDDREDVGDTGAFLRSGLDDPDDGDDGTDADWEVDVDTGKKSSRMQRDADTGRSSQIAGSPGSPLQQRQQR